MGSFANYFFIKITLFKGLTPFKHSSGFTSSLYEFVSNCQELSLVPLKELINGTLRRALETIFRVLDDTKGVKSPPQLPA
jgi:hypothetical protein